MKLSSFELESAIGRVQGIASNSGLCVLGFSNWKRVRNMAEGRFGWTRLGTIAPPPELVAYFEGDLEALANLTVDLNGTPFQKDVWRALLTVPPGHSTTYRELAVQVGRPRSSRALSLAVAANPVAIVVPCHRVVRSDGGLSGYAWGVERKHWLQAHEGMLVH